jgi:hypothetical protein
LDNPIEMMVKQTLTELTNEDKAMRPVAPLIEIHNIHAISNRGKKDEVVRTYDLCDYLTQVIIKNTPCDETETFDVIVDFLHASHKTIEFKTLDEARKLYNDLVAHLQGKSESHVFDVNAYNGM